jgi:valyl-tRNA synthetase
VQLRLLAPFLAFATEEVWSWWREGSVHRAPWPQPAELAERLQGPGDPDVLTTAGEVLTQVRKAKSEAQVTMKTPVTLLRVGNTTPVLDRVRAAQTDIVNAGLVQSLEIVEGDADFVEVTLGEPPAKQ